MRRRFRKSSSKEDAYAIAEELSKEFTIAPYNVDELAHVVRAGARSGELPMVRDGRSFALTNIDDWFKNRVMPNTISLSETLYEKALYRAFRLIMLADIAKTDFGSARQRDFGQFLTDFTRGFLGEIALEQFLKERFELEVQLEEKEVGQVDLFLPTDVVAVREDGSWRDAQIDISIKTSKLRALWLDIPENQLRQSDIFSFIKIGLTVNHFAIFLKETGFVKTLVAIAEEAGEIDDPEGELKALIDSIPDMSPWPSYITGFVTQEDFRLGDLEIDEKQVNTVVEGGCGYYDKDRANKVKGLGDIGGGKYLAALGALRWEQPEWQEHVMERI